MLFLLVLVLFPLSPPPGDCADVQARAEHAYATSAQTPQALVATGAALRAARDCLYETDRRASAQMHVYEIHVLHRSGYGQLYRAAVDEYLRRFTEADGQRQYAFVVRHYVFSAATRGDMAEAFASLNRLLTTIPPTQVQSRVETLLRLGELHGWLMQYDEAVAYIQQADTLVNRHLTGDLRNTQRVRVMIPLVETLMQWYSEDNGGPERLRQAYEAAQEGLRLMPYTTLTNQAHVLHMTGEVYTHLDSLETGARLLREATRLARDGDRFEYVMAAARLARNRMRAGDAVSASLLEEAYQSAMEQAYFTWARYIRQDQAFAARRAGDTVRAKAYLRDAIQLVEDLRAETGTSEWAAGSISLWQIPYRELAQLLAEEDSVYQAVAVLEMVRARHLAALQARLARLTQLGEGDASRADSLITRLTDTREALVHATGRRADSLRMQTASIQHRLDALIGPPKAASPFDASPLHARLAAEHRVVLYYVLDPGERLFPERSSAAVYVMTADTLVRRPIETSIDTLAHRVEQIGEALRADAGGATAPSPAFRLDVLHALYRDLVLPVADFLPEGHAVTIVPDGPLFAVPFAALVTRPVGRFAYAEADYFGARHPLHVTLSLDESSALPRETSGVLVAGKSRFDTTRPPLPPLDGVRREVRAVQSVFGDTRVLLDDEATAQKLVDEARQRRVIHLATHALLDGSSPLYHALVLTPTADDDGLLRLHEIEGMRLDADLVTLSGCNTARGDLRAGEGMAGLQYAFRAVGARSTLSTLWSLSDEASAELFEAFYAHLAEGLPKDVALQRAQATYRSRHPAMSPFFWASPVLYGSTASIDVAAEPSTPLWPLGVIGLSLATALLWHRRRSTLSPASP